MNICIHQSWREAVCNIQHPHLNCPVRGQMEPFGVSFLSFLHLFVAAWILFQRATVHFKEKRWDLCTLDLAHVRRLQVSATQWRGMANSALSGNGIEDWPHGESKILPSLKNKSILRRHSTAMTGCWAEHQLIFPLFLFAQHWNLAWVVGRPMREALPASDLPSPSPSSSPHRLSGKSGGLVVVSWLH